MFVFIFVFIIMGIPFICRYNNARIKQMIHLRGTMFHGGQSTEGIDVRLDSPNSFLSGLCMGSEVSGDEESVKIPRPFRKAFGNTGEIKVGSKITLLKGCWNTKEIVDTLKKTNFGTGSVEWMEDTRENASHFIKSF